MLILPQISVASETVSIVWGFSIGSNQANTVRHIIEEANNSQQKYKFVLENKTGAGGSIAANYVLQNPTNSLVAMSSSFFIRPAFEPSGAHDLDKFQVALVQATGAPLVLVSKKYKTLPELLKQEQFNIGVSGVGSMSDMLANTIKGGNKNVTIVPFKGMLDATTAAAAGHVDSAITFSIDSQAFIDSGEVQIIAYTGKRDFGNYKNLSFSAQGIKGLEDLTANYAIFASKEMPADKIKEINAILSRANASAKVHDSYKKDLLTPVVINFQKSQEWYNSERTYWKTFADRLKK